MGSCRVDLDFHWALLLTQAEEGVGGEIFELIRADGGDAFELCEYGEAENARELSQLCREAQEELQAEMIKAPVKKRVQIQSSTEDLLDAEDADGEDDLEEWLNDRREQQKKMTQAQPVVTQSVHRQTKSTEDAAEMKALIANIEARRNAQKKNAGSKRVGAKTEGSSSLTRAKRTPKPESAAARERRIKAALAEQKAQREAAKIKAIADEADEMAAIIARLDARNKVAASIRRKR